MSYTIEFSQEVKDKLRQLYKSEELYPKDFGETLEALLEDPASVGAHKLQGKMQNLWAFWLTSDLRVVYRKNTDHYLFLLIGPHDEVYYR